MRRRRLLGLTAAATAVGAAGCLGNGSGPADAGESSDGGDRVEWPAGTYADYETTTVTVEGPDGEERGSVTAAIADDRDKLVLGLSDAEALPEDGGMLFVYDSPRERLTFIMPNMDFGIDIVFVDSDREITRIHNAPEPGPNEDGSEQEYDGSGQYVLEVPYEWTDRHGVEVGDSLRFDL